MTDSSASSFERAKQGLDSSSDKAEVNDFPAFTVSNLDRRQVWGHWNVLRASCGPHPGWHAVWTSRQGWLSAAGPTLNSAKVDAQDYEESVLNQAGCTGRCTISENVCVK